MRCSHSFPFAISLFAASGLACIPVEADKRSAFFFWIVFFPLFSGIPVLYIFYACFDVWRRKLLPPSGKRRLLVVYFGRVIFVFITIWIPYFVLLFCFATLVPPSVHFVGGTLSHLQGMISAAVCLLKPDILFAVKRFLTCKCFSSSDENVDSQWLVSSVFARAGRDVDPESGTSMITGPELQHQSSFTVAEVMSNTDVDSVTTNCSLWPNENGTYNQSRTATEGNGNSADDIPRASGRTNRALSEVAEESSGKESSTKNDGSEHPNLSEGHEGSEGTP